MPIKRKRIFSSFFLSQGIKMRLLFPATVPPTAGFAGQADKFAFRDEGRKEAMRFLQKIT
jgi:hypothetical protein